MVNTGKCPRRQVRYATLDEILGDAERLCAAGAPTTGNWSLGQILEHVASVMDKSIDGFENRPPWPLRIVGQFFLKKRFLRNGMPAGFQLKGGIAKELIPAETDAQAALEHLRHAVERLKTETDRPSHPFYGPLTTQESDLLNCRHAELHLSFVAEPNAV